MLYPSILAKELYPKQFFDGLTSGLHFAAPPL
jgi:hypothetical protein